MILVRSTPPASCAVFEHYRSLWIPLLPLTDRERLTKAEDVLSRAGLGER